MRYADGGGLTAERRAAREVIRLEAGQRFPRGDKSSDIAKDLRMSERTVEQWRRAWREGGMEGLKSKGPANLPKLSDERFALLEKELAKGPAAHGWEDQRWTLERVRTLIGGQFGVSCSNAGVRRLLHCHGWSWQSPARCAPERLAGPLAAQGGSVSAQAPCAGAWRCHLEPGLVLEGDPGVERRRGASICGHRSLFQSSTACSSQSPG
ncbi:winged helix-turn-helix domain-containing protein [Streptomyces sp. NPDC020951]|uniref:winged helix-turn-helix domain-containing protein n=1 Tax=Streptomyces sp. NPDC020951 TaxID=3365104 RepID=UPI00379C2A53